MKSQRAIKTRCAAVASSPSMLLLLSSFVVAVHHVCAAQQVPYAGVGYSQDARYHHLMVTVYKMLYCDQKQCPNWRCQDDSAVIHGYCCGCPTPLLGHVAVPCVEDLKCPLKTRDLCEHYHFMTTCCC